MGYTTADALSIQPKLLRALQQLPAVEGDAARPTIRASERVNRPAPAVVPDLGAVQRQHVRHATPRGPHRGDFDDQSVAVEVQEIGIARRLVERGGDDPRLPAACRAEPSDGVRSPGGTPGNAPDSSAREVRGGATLRRGMGDERDEVAAGVRPGAELGRQQRVGGLIGRQDAARRGRRASIASSGGANGRRGEALRPRSAGDTRRTSSARRRDRASRTSGIVRAGRRTHRARCSSGCTDCRRRSPRSSERGD